MRAGGGSRFRSRGCPNPEGETTMTLADHVAIVTGAGNGIGSATALALARAGADVAGVDIDKPAAEETAPVVAAVARQRPPPLTEPRNLAPLETRAGPAPFRIRST